MKTREGTEIDVQGNWSKDIISELMIVILPLMESERLDHALQTDLILLMFGSKLSSEFCSSDILTLK